MASVPYTHLRVSHPEWPKLLKGWIGRHVRLKRDIKNYNGLTLAEVGGVWEVRGSWRGDLSLRRDGPKSEFNRSGKVYLDHVRLHLVELLPADYEPE